MGTVDVFEINNALATGTELLQAFATRRTLDTQQHSSVTIHGTANTSTDKNHETADKIQDPSPYEYQNTLCFLKNSSGVVA